MSYASAAALQEAVYTRLRADTDIASLLGDNIFDTVPAGALPDTYIALGPEEARDRSDVTGSGAEHRFVVAIVTQVAGFSAAKALAGLVERALTTTTITLGEGHLVGLWFDRATARRTGQAGRMRRIDLRFRARIDTN